MNSNEIIKDKEIKDQEMLAAQLAPVRLDLKKLQDLSAARFLKLEKIRTDIPIKRYQLVLEKLVIEKKRIDEEIEKDAKVSIQQNAPQSLPKTFFEKKSLKPKMIRID